MKGSGYVLFNFRKKEKTNVDNTNLYNNVVDFVKENGSIRISVLQRHFNLNFNDAAAIIDKMLEGNIIYCSDDNMGTYYLKQNYVDSINVNDISDIKLQEISNQAFENDYLKNEDRKMVLANGKTLEETIKDGYKNAILSAQNSTNPKFHRTPHEQELSFCFSQSYREILDEMEKVIYDLDEEITQIRKKSKKIKNYSKDEIINLCEKEISAYNNLKEFCYSNGEGGKLYFQNMWEYCHYNWNDCFPFIKNTLKYYDKLKKSND